MTRPSRRRVERREHALYVVAEWEDADGSPRPAGPRRLAIEVAADAAEGITSGVMRRADRHLTDMTAEFHEFPSIGGHALMVRRYVEDRLAALPTERNDYHRGLLDIYDDLVSRGNEQPEKVIADALRVPEQTAQACLHTARQHVDHGA